MALGGRDLRRGGERGRAQRRMPTLPDDAAPRRSASLVVPNDIQTDKTPDFYESVYERLSEAHRPTSSASRWSGSTGTSRSSRPARSSGAATRDGTIWTFKLDPDLMWSDGNPVTANDWVTTFRTAPIPPTPGTSPGSSRA